MIKVVANTFYYAVALAFGLLAPAVAAQESGTRLSGTLVSEGDGAPVDGAVVLLVGGDDVVVWETLSSASGAFSLPLPPPGTYRVRVARIGYESWTSGTIRIDSAQASGPLRLEIPVRPVRERKPHFGVRKEVRNDQDHSGILARRRADRGCSR